MWNMMCATCTVCSYSVCFDDNMQIKFWLGLSDSLLEDMMSWWIIKQIGWIIFVEYKGTMYLWHTGTNIQGQAF